VDVEGAELAVLPEWLDSGALARVEQLAMEFHLVRIHRKVSPRWQEEPSLQARFVWLLSLLQRLFQLGFRVISHEVNMAMAKKVRESGYTPYLETVLMRDRLVEPVGAGRDTRQ
jgi:hypothetical protein